MGDCLENMLKRLNKSNPDLCVLPIRKILFLVDEAFSKSSENLIPEINEYISIGGNGFAKILNIELDNLPLDKQLYGIARYLEKNVVDKNLSQEDYYFLLAKINGYEMCDFDNKEEMIKYAKFVL